LQLAAPPGRAQARNDSNTSQADRGGLPAEVTLGRLVATSALMRAVFDRLKRIAQRDVTLLLEGASGTGKGLAAQAVHAASPRRDHPLVVVDCAAAPLLEADLFGQGAASGAFARAEGGTVFLDEVGALPGDLQPRLLRLIEQREPMAPAGGAPVRRADVRIVAATNCNLRHAIAHSLFRADLYYRLAVTCVRLPSLAERSEDIPLLCRSLLAELNERDGTDHALDQQTLARLCQRAWPGNVRELRNALERITSYGSEDLEPEQPACEDPHAELPRFHTAKAEVVARFERGYLREILAHKGGNITAAAAAAGVDRVHFLRLLDRHGLRKGQRPLTSASVV
jgi:two-component system, NtrC family, response regulator GlrR